MRVRESLLLRRCDALDLLASTADGSVSLVLTDPPYALETDDAYLAWVERLMEEWCRVLAPNGSLYAFCSPAMCGRVEELARRAGLRVLNSIAWKKPDHRGRRARADRNRLRSYVADSERVVFACRDDVFLFSSIREYLVSELGRAGLTRADVHREWLRAGRNGQMVARWFGHGNRWLLPSRSAYSWLRSVFRNRNPDALIRSYDELAAEQECLRRPFFPRSPLGDVWDFEPVPPGGKDRHPHEKPREMAEHVVSVSSRPGDLVLDCFMGSGVFGEAAVSLGRRFVGCEVDPARFARAEARIRQVASESC